MLSIHPFQSIFSNFLDLKCGCLFFLISQHSRLCLKFGFSHTVSVFLFNITDIITCLATRAAEILFFFVCLLCPYEFICQQQDHCFPLLRLSYRRSEATSLLGTGDKMSQRNERYRWLNWGLIWDGISKHAGWWRTGNALGVAAESPLSKHLLPPVQTKRNDFCLIRRRFGVSGTNGATGARWHIS